MKLTVVLGVLVGTLVLACSSAAPAPVEPTPNTDATVEARVAQERAVDATVEARMAEERASQPTSIPSPTDTQASIPTYTPHPTYTPYPTPTNTPTVVPTATSVPTPTARPIPTPTPTPTPTLGPTPTPTPTPLPTPLPAHFYKGCSFGQESPAPWVFLGEVSYIDWSDANDETSVSAWIGSIEMAHTQLSNKSYLLLVPRCQDSREFNYYSGGAIVKFSIDGFWAEQTSLPSSHVDGISSGPWIHGDGEELNLHQTNDPVVIN